jgi:RNA polymerase sigma-70 factor (ECF subfamily)
MSDLSPETRALLGRARGGDTLPAIHRTALRRRLAGALGLAAPLTLGATAAASVTVGTWAVRGIAVLGTASVLGMAVLAPAPAVAPPAHVGTVDRIAAAHPARPGRPSGLAAEPMAPPAPPDAPSEALPEPTEPPPAASGSPHPGPPRPATSLPHRRLDVERVEDPLTAEVRLVGDARNAIGDGDAARALEVLAEHGRRFARGALAPEAAALRVDALCIAGRVADAEAEVRRFEALYPGSPLTRRFASTCARAATSAIAP